ncbi:MAG TPA: hypothetical protein VLK58_07595 [Conexibacter sp.]|nr:hypothetical protein [Conexibacter sp.]
MTAETGKQRVGWPIPVGRQVGQPPSEAPEQSDRLDVRDKDLRKLVGDVQRPAEVGGLLAGPGGDGLEPRAELLGEDECRGEQQVAVEREARDVELVPACARSGSERGDCVGLRAELPGDDPERLGGERAVAELCGAQRATVKVRARGEHRGQAQSAPPASTRS